MISYAAPVPIGNAVRLVVVAPAGSVDWRVLRNTSGTFTGYNDANSATVLSFPDDLAIDALGLANGTPYHYAAFYTLDGATWFAADTAVVTPATTYEFDGQDVLDFVRERVKSGLAAAVAAGALSHATGAIPTLTAPPIVDETKWPVVTVHLRSDRPEIRGLGELADTDEFDDGDWSESEGWLARNDIQVVGWSLNPDERIALRKAIKQIIIGNLPVFDAVGLKQIDFSQSDVEILDESLGAPVYQVMGEFSCLAPAIISDVAPPISDVIVTASMG